MNTEHLLLWDSAFHLVDLGPDGLLLAVEQEVESEIDKDKMTIQASTKLDLSQVTKLQAALYGWLRAGKLVGGPMMTTPAAGGLPHERPQEANDGE